MLLQVTFFLKTLLKPIKLVRRYEDLLSSVLPIFANFGEFLTLHWCKKTNDVRIKHMMSAQFSFNLL